jgi:uncharacterized membrane protein
MRKSYSIILILVSITLIAATMTSGPENGPKRGYINNIDGEQCWYDQEVKKNNSYFHEDLKGVNGIMTFDDPACMVENSTNKMMINNVISNWYSHDDANFKTRERELYDGSMLQVKGECMQSETYPAIGIMVDYFTENGNITGVIHGGSVQGCKNK